MIVHDCLQGSTRWLMLRMGMPTASCFSRIITNTGSASKQCETYMRQLLAERLRGKAEEDYQSPWMERGLELEAEAAAFYAGRTTLHVKQVGFVTDDKGVVGCSPDRLVGDEGLLQIKCPKASTHVGYLLDNAELAKDYRAQCQGELWITGRPWLDILSYPPEGLKACVVRVERDGAYIERLARAIEVFCEQLGKRAALLDA